MYDGEEIEFLSAHIARFIGDPEHVLHNLIPQDLHIDIYLVPPRPERDFLTLVTTGMSEFPMATPEEMDFVKYAELMLALPKSWSADSEDDDDGWPTFWLEQLARAPHEYDTWFGEGHTIPNGDPPGPLGEGTTFCCWLIRKPKTAPEDFHILKRPDGEGDIYFWAAVPIYKDEMEYCLNHGYKALAKLLDQAGVTEIIDVKRPSVVSGIRPESV